MYTCYMMRLIDVAWIKNFFRNSLVALLEALNARVLGICAGCNVFRAYVCGDSL